MPQLAAGDRAPEFVLPDQDGRTVSLEDLRVSTDKGVIVYFYPKACTPGCTKEACDFRDSLEGLKAADIKKQWPEHYATWRAGGELPQFRIEGRRQTAERVGEALKTIVAGSQKGDVIVAVSHGAATNLGATYLLGMDTQQWFGLRGMSNCCYALMRTNKRPPGWSVVKWNAGPPVDSSPLGKILG